ncbi:MAG: hypothetical protein L3K06_08825, partial [Thermoplasmata archaeon]|nr:hypothetical protein [Thermoplasmata archaeon]
TLRDVTGIPFASYDPSTGATSGTATPIHALQVISLSAGFQGLSGDFLVLVGVGTFQGSIAVSIP